MWLFKQFIKRTIEAAVKARVTFTNSSNFYHDDAFKSYSTIVQFVLKSYVADDTIAKMDAKESRFRHGLMTPEE